MHTKKFKFGLTIFVAVLLTLGLSISLQSLLAAWTAPTSAPPNGNIAAPINVGSTPQTKAASIGIGVGLTSPNSLLHVYQTSGNNAEIDIQSVAGANKHWGIYHDRATNDLRFWNNSAPGDKNVLTITNEGSVGIGTTAPNRRLEIYESRDDGVLVGIRVNNPSGSAAYANVRFGMELYNSGNYEGGLWATRESKLYLQSGASNKPLVLQNNAGNVGIGTTAPGQKLHVIGNIQASGDIYLGTRGAWLSSWLNQAVLTTSGPTFSTVYTSNWFRSTGNTGWYSQTYGGGWFMQDSTWIRAYGNKNVYTAGEIQAGTVRGNSQLCIGNNCRTSWPTGIGGSGTTNYIAKFTAGTTIGNSQIYDNGTNVGIGTTGPAAGSKLDVNGKIFEYGKALLPRGVIVMWSGTLANIPAGWALCNGGTYTAPNGDSVTTPDLRDRFIYGTSANENPGATGGASTYTLTTDQLPVHSHSISADGEHTHSMLLHEGYDGNSGDYHVNPSGGSWVSGYISSAGSHSHGGKTGDIGSGASIDNRPSYYKLAFIMKL